LVQAGRISERDALHAATALTYGFSEVVSTDPDFDAAEALRRLDPKVVSEEL
jgi:predicted nucleic acid-binding protein